MFSTLRRTVAAAAFALAVFASGALPSGAIVGGVETGTAAHSNVGAMGYDSGTHCSGVLISPRVFLTAAHCTAYFSEQGKTRAWVSFDPTIRSSSIRRWGTVVEPENYKFTRTGRTMDVAAVVLDEAVTGVAPAKLAPVGLVDEYVAAGATHDVLLVGYGATSVEKSYIVGRGTRRSASSSYLRSTDVLLTTSQAANSGGTCGGDSGGPRIIESDGQAFVAALTSWGDGKCAAFSSGYRLDTEAVHTFIEGLAA